VNTYLASAFSTPALLGTTLHVQWQGHNKQTNAKMIFMIMLLY